MTSEEKLRADLAEIVLALNARIDVRDGATKELYGVIVKLVQCVAATERVREEQAQDIKQLAKTLAETRNEIFKIARADRAMTYLASLEQRVAELAAEVRAK